MQYFLKLIGLALGLCLFLLVIYGGKGFVDGLRDSDLLAKRADNLIAAGYGPKQLGTGRLEELLKVEDPGFYDHGGIDLSSLGAGLTTITQSLAKRLAFDGFKPGIRKLRQSTYALGLEQGLLKDQILALFLETVEMGRGPDGWMTGFFNASEEVYGKPVSELSDHEFLRLVAVMIAPANYDLFQPDPELEERVARIERLVAGNCKPNGLMDVWLEGCAAR
ncbi:transglycosylase domain-containing protein [Rhizobium sp. L1K21]|uniref:transglycosylase domain-containing protein n=1 Tax=Rhizobium sp. L1K21 TaxID=2954933 RepID=UPI002093EDF9|nr:transglycosylase domain-containing protein [Rhizobium sp. L1K21]MCO6186584.1 transglycosylase domain-containing protein [Rhizobium sp. L1K21]